MAKSKKSAEQGIGGLGDGEMQAAPDRELDLSGGIAMSDEAEGEEEGVGDEGLGDGEENQNEETPSTESSTPTPQPPPPSPAPPAGRDDRATLNLTVPLHYTPEGFKQRHINGTLSGADALRLNAIFLGLVQHEVKISEIPGGNPRQVESVMDAIRWLLNQIHPADVVY